MSREIPEDISQEEWVKMWSARQRDQDLAK
jgi:hypothetical protein